MHTSPEWLGQAVEPAQATSEAWGAYIRAVRDNLNGAFTRASSARNALKRTRERLGLPFLIEQSGEGQAAGAWNEGLDQDLLRAGSMVATLSRFADEALAGTRRFGYDQNDELAFERLDGDFSRVEIRGGQPVEIENATNAPVRVTGSLGLPPIIVGIIVVAAIVTTYFAVEQVCETIEHTAESRQIETLSTNGAALIKSGKATPEQVKALNDSIYEGAAAVHEARALEETKGKSEIPQTIRTVGFIALGLGALYIVWQLINRSGGRAPALARMLENPVRRSGDVKVRINYRDAEEDYAGVVTWPGGSWRFDELRASPHWQRTHAVDSAETYDEVSRAALSFGADENEDIYAYADTNERGDFVVRRR